MITFVLAHSLNRCTFAILAFEVLVDVADAFNHVKVKTRTAKKNQNKMGMRLKRQLLSVKFWIFLAFFLYKNRLVASRHAKQTLTLFDQSTKDKNLKVKIKRNLEAKIDLQLQDAISCDCRDFCFDPQSSELQVSFRKFYNKLISFIQVTTIIPMTIRTVCVGHISVNLHIILFFVYPNAVLITTFFAEPSLD